MTEMTTLETSKVVKESLKILIIGESGVGKSSLLSQFIHGKFNTEFTSTIGIDFGSKTIIVKEEEEEENVRYHILLKIFDTAGQKRFKTITEHYQTINIDGIIIVIDITSSLSFETAPELISRARELTGKGESLPILLVCNKIDLDKKRCISRDGLEVLARVCNVEYKEISVKENVKDCESVFDIITHKIVHNRKSKKEQDVVYNDTSRKSVWEWMLRWTLMCNC